MPAVAFVISVVGAPIAAVLRVPRQLLERSIRRTPYRHGLTAGAMMAGLAMMVAICGSAAARQAAPRSVSPRGPFTAEENATIETFRRVSPSVVYITTLDRVVNPFTMNVREVPRGTGSGFLWDELGHIVTNYHVIYGADAITVTLADRTEYKAKVVGADPDHDLAVLQIQASEAALQPVIIGNSQSLRVGQ
ncbi:MAG: trypsin-like peptidase domain-containing protein, partial [Bryobacterales bacterium]|nr:trypsin-like peptidase domain-containing protein [Bryobacterales bacterium]